MSITNELTNHVDTIRRGLLTLSLRSSDRILQILDTRARYTDAPGSGYSFTHLRDVPKALFYRGTDRYEAAESNPKTTQLVIPWTNLMVPIQFSGTDLEEMLSIKANKLLSDNYSMQDMGADKRNMFLNLMEDHVTAAAAGIQSSRISCLWGRSEGLYLVDPSRLPISLKDIFDETTGLYGKGKEALGEFEDGHVWKRSNFGASEPYLMTPRIWDFREDDGTKPANTADPARKLSGANDREQDENFDKLVEIVNRYSEVVPGTKVAICDTQVFSRLSTYFKDSDKFPLLVGNDKWSFTINCVVIQDVYFMSDPNKSISENSIDVLHIGDLGASGMEAGTIYPFYWRSGDSVRQNMQTKVNEMLSKPPGGMEFGPRREIPIDMDDFERFAGMADAVGSHLRLKYMLICTEPWCQLQIRQIAA